MIDSCNKKSWSSSWKQIDKHCTENEAGQLTGKTEERARKPGDKRLKEPTVNLMNNLAQKQLVMSQLDVETAGQVGFIIW